MKKITYLITLIMTIFLISQITLAQEPKEKIANDLATMMQQTRDEMPITISSKDILAAGEPHVALELLKPYEKDISPRVRERAYTVGWQIAKSSRYSKVRQEVTARLVKALSDPNGLVWQQASERLLDFNSADFTNVTKETIHQIFIKGDPVRENYIVRVIGVANMQDEMTTLKKLLIDETKYDSVGKWYGTVGWAARLARARMGSKADIARAIELVEVVPNDVTRVTTLLRHIAYIRQSEAIKVLHRYLNSDERLPRVKETVPGARYSQYALDLLAQIIEGFPIKSVGPNYSQSEIELAREWMKNKDNWIHSIRK